MNDQLPPFTQGDWVLTEVTRDLHTIAGDGIESSMVHAPLEVARLMSLAPKLYRALVALADVAKVQSDAEYRAVLDARDVIVEVLGS